MRPKTRLINKTTQRKSKQENKQQKQQHYFVPENATSEKKPQEKGQTLGNKFWQR